MMVADDHIDALGLGIIHLLDGLDAAIEGYDQAETVLGCPVNSFI